MFGCITAGARRFWVLLYLLVLCFTFNLVDLQQPRFFNQKSLASSRTIFPRPNTAPGACTRLEGRAFQLEPTQLSRTIFTSCIRATRNTPW